MLLISLDVPIGVKLAYAGFQAAIDRAWILQWDVCLVFGSSQSLIENDLLSMFLVYMIVDWRHESDSCSFWFHSVSSGLILMNGIEFAHIAFWLDRIADTHVDATVRLVMH